MAVIAERAESVLNRRWKRILFVFWVPLALATICFSTISIVCVYHVYVRPDSYYLRKCHQIAYEFSLNDPAEFDQLLFDDPERGMNKMADYRIANRFSSETREAERSGKFILCMANSQDSMYWVDFDFFIVNTKLFALWTVVLGAFIAFGGQLYQFTVLRLWRWINLR